MRHWPGSGSMCRTKERDEIAAAAHLHRSDMVGAAAAAGGRDVAAEPAHVVKFPEG